MHTGIAGLTDSIQHRDTKKLKPTHHSHYLQSSEWVAVKTNRTPWRYHTIPLPERSIGCFKRTTSIGNVLYIPGFIPENKTELAHLTTTLPSLSKLNAVCKIEPCIPYDKDIDTLFTESGWKKSRRVQVSHTVRFDLTKPDDQLLKEMKKRARYEVKKSAKNDVHVIDAEPNNENLSLMYELLSTTARRKQFTVRSKSFILDFWENFRKSDHLRLYFAVHENDVLAGAVVITNPEKTVAWYKEGASTTNKSNLLGPRLLLWEAAKALKAEGIEIFDLGGIPDPKTYKQSRMKGIYIFKSAFVPEVTEMMPAYEIYLNKFASKQWPLLERALNKQASILSKMWY